MRLLPFLRRASLAVLAGALVVSGLVTHTASTHAAPAGGFSARIECANDDLSIEFTWQSSGDGQQWLDLSATGGSFAPGTFAGTGPMAPSRESLDWSDPERNTTYYARINTYDGSGWAASDTLTFTTPACGALPPVDAAPLPVPSAAMAGLQVSLEAQIAAVGFEAAVAVTDLQTGETISVNGNRQQLTGCVINLLALMQAVIDVENGLYAESQVGQLISATIYGSNPVTARDILLISGNGDIPAAQRKINGLIQQLGLTSTFYDHPPAYWPSYSLEGRSNLTTALDMNKALSGLWNAAVMSPEWRDYLLAKMTEVKPGLNYLIPAGVGDGVVSHKNGFLALEGWVDNDTGIVSFQRGGQTYAYAITFLTQSVPTKYGDIPLGQTVSSLVWQHFTSTYQ